MKQRHTIARDSFFSDAKDLGDNRTGSFLTGAPNAGGVLIKSESFDNNSKTVQDRRIIRPTHSTLLCYHVGKPAIIAACYVQKLHVINCTWNHGISVELETRRVLRPATMSENGRDPTRIFLYTLHVFGVSPVSSYPRKVPWSSNLPT